MGPGAGLLACDVSAMVVVPRLAAAADGTVDVTVVVVVVHEDM